MVGIDLAELVRVGSKVGGDLFARDQKAYRTHDELVPRLVPLVHFSGCLVVYLVVVVRHGAGLEHLAENGQLPAASVLN